MRFDKFSFGSIQIDGAVYCSRNFLEGSFLRLRISPRSIMTSCSCLELFDGAGTIIDDGFLRREWDYLPPRCL